MRPASEQLQALLDVIKSGDFVVIDNETTGVDERAEIVQTAVMASDGRILLNTFVHPTYPIPVEVTAINHITNEMVKEALPFPSELLQELLKGRNVIGYNMAFDLSMLYRSTKHANMPYVDWRNLAKWHCAMLGFAEVYGVPNRRMGGYSWQKLSAAAEYYNILQENEHTALGDVSTTLKLCKAMVAS